MIDNGIANLFEIPFEKYELIPYGNGHINRTYVLQSEKNRFLLQKINNFVFPDVEGLMSNIEKVCAFRAERALKENKDCSKYLTPIKTKEGKYFTVVDGEYYRLYNFIEDTVSIDIPDSAEHFGEGGRYFAEFALELNDFDATTLVDVIAGFHDTKKRVEKFKKVLAEDKFDRRKEVEELVSFALERAEAAGIVYEKIDSGEIPLRVTHNDTKFNNLLFDEKSRKPVSIVDFDTIMKGSLLFDFGDAVRTGCCTAAEDEHDLSKVNFAKDFYDCFANAYSSVLGDKMSDAEKKLLGFSSMLMTYECGVRFLTDYLEGDVYFATHYDKQNVFRAKTQFKLVGEMEKVFGGMTEYIGR